MFVCRACARRASTYPLRRLPIAPSRTVAPVKTFATTPIRRYSPASAPEHPSSDWGYLEAVADKEEKEVDHEAKELDDPEGKVAAREKALEKLKRAVKIELKLTTDPYHIAESISRKLAQHEYEKALLMTREASRDKQVVVCWNHLIAYEFTNQRLHSAFKLYNEVTSLQPS